jgi:hypothetical protein
MVTRGKQEVCLTNFGKQVCLIQDYWCSLDGCAPVSAILDLSG